ncbi:hypothetical protein A45J_1246 [hot springs metagenome]|uniref:Uncharacterized protein n=1 Tax=hot springs metagenome TaxID=433727 RepID=A0A5J4L2L3_9ZZZZ
MLILSICFRIPDCRTGRPTDTLSLELSLDLRESSSGSLLFDAFSKTQAILEKRAAIY